MQHYAPHRALSYVLIEWLRVSQVEKNKRVSKTYSVELRPDMGESGDGVDIWTVSLSYPHDATQLSARDDFIKLHPLYFPAYKIRPASNRPLCVLFLSMPRTQPHSLNN